MPPKATCPNQHIISILQKRVDELRKEKPDSFQIPGLLKAIKNVRAHPQWLANGAEAQKAIAGIGPAVAKMIDEGIAQLPAPPRPVVTEALGVSLVTSREVRPFFDTEDEQNDFYDLLADTVTPRRSRGGIDMPSLTSRTPADTPRADFQTPSQFGIGVLPPQTPLVGVHMSRSQQTTSTQPQQRQQQPILTPQPPTTETPSSSAAAGAAPSASSASLSGNPSVPKRMRTIDVAPTFGTPNYAILVSLLAAKHATPPVTLISAQELIPRTEPKLTPVLFESTMSDLLERGMVDVTSRKKQYCLTDEGHKLATDAYNLARRLRKEQRIISGVSAISTPMPSPTVGPLGNSLAGSSRAAGGASVTNRSVSSNSTASSRTSASHSLGPSPELLELRDDLDDALLYPGRVVVTSNTQRSRTTHRASSSAVLSGPVDETSVIILDSDDDPPTYPRASEPAATRRVTDAPFIDSLGNAGDWRDSTFLSEKLDTSASNGSGRAKKAPSSSASSSRNPSPPPTANRGATALSTLDRRAASDQQPSHWAASSRSVTPPAPSSRTVFSLASPSPEHNPLPSARPPASTASSSSSRNPPLPPQPTRTVSSSSASSNPSSSIPRSSSSTVSSSSSSLPRVPSTTPAPSTFAAAATTAANEEAIPDAPAWGPTPIVTLPPESYDIVILLDNREQSRQDREFFQRHLQNQGVFVDTVTLPVGDMAWAARPREGVDGPLGTLQRGLGPQTYVLLDYIAERKRIDDLRTSIHDNRWIEQKWRLEGSALTNLHYIVEEAAAVMQRVTSDPATVKAIMTAKVQTIAWSGFNLHVTRSDQETAELLAQITMMIARLWKPHPLHVVMSEHVKSRADWTAFRKFGVVDSMSKQLVPMTRPQLQSIWHHQGALNRCLMSPHILLSRLSDFSGKSSQVQLRDFFTRMLMTIQGVSAEKARFLVKYFPTPYSLHEAYQKVPEADRPLFLARFFDDLEAQQGMLGRKKIKEALSRRIAEVFTSSQYSDAQVGTDD